MTTNYPPAEQRTPPFPTYPPARPRTWPAVALSVVAALLGAAALIVALTRPTTGGTTAGPATSAPTYTAAEVAAAHQKVCDVYKLAARAVQIQTNRDDPALANISTVNGAVMLQQAVSAAPALARGDRIAALALADAYSNSTAVASFARGRDDPAWRTASDDVIAKDAQMKALCGGG
ncbi:hypothetical protein B4U45_02155 [Mycobacterium persicum]|uniref:Uncharacterized protein n=1 Tax=Mycobacterium persicum TaxID=1487726 RepID=A0A8E2ITY4_9MYCO|nr:MULTISPECIES: hypothetical protein [Mycobacterium]ORB93563.1 hypothetical protein B1T44_02145 [Mycobacterium persicum]ORB93568.1 hypothetical protein B1T44_02180 [Mycobacterium persicum]ORC05637.1 hypothetical protein B4U45_02100 [Mycobacterium persicum]ORC05645.1 hypothetical protein B4U45_02155 [Mycobacterium persicum]